MKPTTSDDSLTAMLEKPRRGRVKCVVWDLDETVWDGVLLEGDEVRPRPEVVRILKAFDERGILHSIASRNDFGMAMERLERFGLAAYFLHPQINWNSKASSVTAVSRLLNIGLDAIAFVDDQPFELQEVAFTVPDVLCVNASDIVTAANEWQEFLPRFITEESRQRREMYRSETWRDRAEEEFVGTSEEFLATLDMVFTIAPAEREDLRRAEELTVRTNQLNSTGRTYSYEELDELRQSPDHLLLVATLEDRFGSYGKIGLALVDTRGPIWTLRLLLMSCRVMSRGVGTVLLNHVMSLARSSGGRLQAAMVETDRNRMMYVTYKFAGFREVARDGNAVVLEADLSRVQKLPRYLTVISP